MRDKAVSAAVAMPLNQYLKTAYKHLQVPRGNFQPQDPEAVTVRRCLRHSRVELLEDAHYVAGGHPGCTESGLRCPVDGERVNVWEVWDRVQGRRLWVADSEVGARGGHVPSRRRNRQR